MLSASVLKRLKWLGKSYSPSTTDDNKKVWAGPYTWLKELVTLNDLWVMVTKQPIRHKAELWSPIDHGMSSTVKSKREQNWNLTSSCREALLLKITCLSRQFSIFSWGEQTLSKIFEILVADCLELLSIHSNIGLGQGSAAFTSKTKNKRKTYIVGYCGIFALSPIIL